MDELLEFQNDAAQRVIIFLTFWQMILQDTLS